MNSRFRMAWYSLVLGGCLFLSNPPMAAAQAPPQPEEAVAQQTRLGCAWILAPQDNDAVSMGTGWLLDRGERLLLTNRHVVGQSTTVKVMFPLKENSRIVTYRPYYQRMLPHGLQTYQGKVLATDAKRDLALIQLDQVPAAIHPLKLAEQSSLPGDPVHLIGNPGAGEDLWVYNWGTTLRVSSTLAIDVRSGQQFKARHLFLQAHHPVTPGYSGGPVVNEEGRLVGVTAMTGNRDLHQVTCVDLTEVKDFVAATHSLVHPVSATDFKNAGAFCYNQGLYQQALLHFHRAVSLEPKDADAYIWRGASLVKLRKFDQAIADYNQALALEEHNPWAYNNRGEAYRLLGAYDRALADFTRAVQVNPDYAPAYYNRSLVYRTQGALRLARDDYRKALEMAPDLADFKPEESLVERQSFGEAVQKFLPDDTTFLLLLNLKNLVTSAAIKKYVLPRAKQALQAQDQVRKFLFFLGIDPFYDLTDLALAYSRVNASGKPEGLILLVQGWFDMDKIQNLAENAFKLTKVPDGLGGYYRLYETKAPQQKSSLFLALVNGTTLVLSPEPEEVLAVLEKGAGWRKTGLRHPEIQAALNKLDEKQALRVVVLGSALAKNGAPSLAGLESLAAGATVSEGMEGEFFFTFKEADVAAKALSPFEKELRALEPQVRDAAGKNKLLTPLVELVRSATVRAQGNTLVVKGRVSAAVLAQTFQPDAPAQPLIPKGPNPYLPVRPPVVRANPQDASDATPLLDKESGRLVVLVPAQARLEIAGVQTRQTGEIRRFDSPPISRGETFHYHVKATWQEGGRNVVREKEVQILAGEETQVDLR